MLGNDVIDLSNAGTCHPRFDARVFTASERALMAAPRRARVRWLLWAAKESAYKAARKDDPRAVFSPARFVVEPLDPDGVERGGCATVVHEAHRFDVELTAGNGWVHAIARREGTPAQRTLSAVAPRRDDDESAAVRRLAIGALAAVLDVGPGRLAIHREGRDGRVPVLWFDGRRVAADLSLSHHARFVAFACDLP